MLTKYFSAAVTLIMGAQASQTTQQKDANKLTACDVGINCPEDDGDFNFEEDNFDSLVQIGESDEEFDYDELYGDVAEDFEWYEDCENSNGGAVDQHGDDCQLYDVYPEECGYYDTEEFVSAEMCCVCKNL